MQEAMGNAKEAWLVVADSQSARLLHATVLQQGRVHVDEAGTLQTTFVEGERHRPTRLSQPGRSGPIGHDHEAKNFHFARELAPWIEQQLRARGIARCPIFAPSHLLGALRQSASRDLAARLVEHEAELARLSAAELAQHPRIAALLSP
jgi:protein required for attachment to host cells